MPQSAVNAAKGLGGGRSSGGGSSSSGVASASEWQQQMKLIKEQRKINKESLKDVQKGIELKRKYDEQRRKADTRADLAAAAAKRKVSMEDTLESIKLITAANREKRARDLEAAIANGESTGKIMKAALASGAAALGDALANGAMVLYDKVSKSIESGASLYSKYMSSVDARIQGAYTGLSFETLIDMVNRNLSGNPYLKYEDVVDKMASLIDKGVVSNVAQRAFLATISEKIATTFDAMDDTLLRIVRIQRADTTAERLGMEAELTKLFNYYFSDTSYLSEAFDSVTSALLDVSAQLGAIGGVELEYQVQKWLGSMGSSGVSESTVSAIAGAINALGTGDVDYLTSNTEMQNLLVLSMNRAGLDYGELLTGGINSLDVNELLYNMILFIRETVSGTNNVVKRKYAELFGLTMADVAAIENMNNAQIAELYTQAMTAGDMMTSLNEQLAQVPNRVHFSELLQNIIDNTVTTAGMSIANSSVAYTTYKIADLVEGITGGIKIPFISVLGSGVQLPNSIEEYIKIGVTGMGLMSSLFSAIGNWASGGMLDLNRWNATWESGEGAKSYSGFTSRNELSTSSSSSGFVTNTDQKGMQQSIVDEQKGSAEDIQGESREEDSEVIIILRALRDYFENGGSSSKPLMVSITQGASSENTVDGTQKLDLVTLTNDILSRLLEMGTSGDPVYTTGSPYGLNYGTGVQSPVPSPAM